MKYLGLDIETGGIGHDKSLLTVYMATYNEKLEPCHYNYNYDLSLEVKPEDGIYRTTAEALRINGIDLTAHDLSAETPTKLKAAVYTFIQNASNNGANKLIPLGHNVKFDIEFITKANDKIISKDSWDHFVSYRCADTGSTGMFLKAAGLVPESISGSLSSWANHFGISTDGAHTAKCDVEMTVEVYKKMLELVRKK
jgi:DNA polymerase III epsilon subunit-like protein